jgi:hypothetical protein
MRSELGIPPPWLTPDHPCLPDSSDPFCKLSAHLTHELKRCNANHVTNVLIIGCSGCAGKSITPLIAARGLVRTDDLSPKIVSVGSPIAGVRRRTRTRCQFQDECICLERKQSKQLRLLVWNTQWRPTLRDSQRGDSSEAALTTVELFIVRDWRSASCVQDELTDQRDVQPGAVYPCSRTRELIYALLDCPVLTRKPFVVWRQTQLAKRSHGVLPSGRRRQKGAFNQVHQMPLDRVLSSRRA